MAPEAGASESRGCPLYDAGCLSNKRTDAHTPEPKPREVGPEDYVPQKDYNPEDLPEHHRLAYKRRVTAILPLCCLVFTISITASSRSHLARLDPAASNLEFRKRTLRPPACNEQWPRYLQEDWRENLGGSFRAHAVRPERAPCHTWG